MSETESTFARATTESAGLLLRRAHAGDQTVVPELRAMLDNRAIVDVLGNLSRRIEGDVIDKLAGSDLALREGLTRKLTNLRVELAGQAPAALELQLVERVVLCWLFLHGAEYQFAQASGLSIKQADAWQKRIHQLHRRYLSAVKMLATVRRLAIPVLVGQINIASRQANLNCNMSSPAE